MEPRADPPHRRNLICDSWQPMSRPPRLPDFPYVGKYTYFLTTCTVRRQPVLRDEPVARMVVAQIRRTSRQFSFALLAYCVMPDHVHLLVAGRSDTSDLRRFVKRLKQSTGQLFAHHAQQPLWQEGYYDRVLRPEEAEAMIARYIIENPVRAGLVQNARDYPYLGSDAWPIDEIVDAFL